MIQTINRREALGGLAAGAMLTLALPNGNALAQDGPIRVGALVPLSGAAGAYGPSMAKAAEVTAEYVNQNGGILDGRKIEVIVEDTESNPTAGVNAARKLLDVDGVDALIGVWNSSVAMPLKPVVLERDMLLFVWGRPTRSPKGRTRG